MSGALEPAIACYETKVRSGERLDPAWEAIRAQGRRRDSLEEDRYAIMKLKQMVLKQT